MKLSTLTLSRLTPALAMAGSGDFLETCDLHGDPESWDCHRVDAHAPIGVMADHTHNAGEWMLSYRFMRMRMDGMRDGTSNLSSSDIFALGYPVAPTSMEMDMHMFGLMYAPTDALTLAAMGNYQELWMDHDAMPGSMPAMMMGEQFRRTANGWGDLTLKGLYKFHETDGQRAHMELGVSAPTGEFNEKAYPMQPTTGTWDLIAGLTWLWQGSQFSGGAQARVRVPFDDNKYGYKLGEQVTGTTWAAWKLSDWASVSGRLTVEWRDRISGVDERIGMIMAPPMEASNHGGTWVEGGLGLNLQAPGGPLAGNRIAIEALLPIYQDLNGPQMKRDWTIIAGVQVAF